MCVEMGVARGWEPMVLLVASYPYVGCSSYGHSATQRHSMRIRMWGAFYFYFLFLFWTVPRVSGEVVCVLFF